MSDEKPVKFGRLIIGDRFYGESGVQYKKISLGEAQACVDGLKMPFTAEADCFNVEATNMFGVFLERKIKRISRITDGIEVWLDGARTVAGSPTFVWLKRYYSGPETLHGDPVVWGDGRGVTYPKSGVIIPVSKLALDCGWLEARVTLDLKEPAGLSEQDPSGRPPSEPGAKLDAGKIQASLLDDFAPALLAIAQVCDFGAKKYSRHGWLSVPDGVDRYNDAAARHHLAWASGEKLDKDSGLPHEFHECWNRLAALTLRLKGDSDIKSEGGRRWNTPKQNNDIKLASTGS